VRGSDEAAQGVRHTSEWPLLPPSPRGWLPDDHLANLIDNVVDQLDLSELFAGYDGTKGQPPYPPQMMIGVWLCSYCVGIRSSRRLERALYEDDGLRMKLARENAPVARWMNYRLKLPENRERYRKREQSVEPVFGQIKQTRGLRQFLLRGLDKVAAVWQLDCAAHNLLKLYRSGVPLQPASQGAGRRQRLPAPSAVKPPREPFARQKTLPSPRLGDPVPGEDHFPRGS
jgi:hypothetical protein